MPYLFAASVGPVQEFIAAARRTRDLWFGSYLLSELSKAVAFALQSTEGAGGQLIFPAPLQPKVDLQPDSPFSASNVMLAILPDQIEPSRFWKDLRVAAEDRWKALANQVYADIRREWVAQDRWDAQLANVVEFYAAWIPLGASNDYRACRARVMRLLAGRKATRDFPAWLGERGVPKSSLDGARETVFVPLQREQTLERATALKLSDGEELDAIGLVKRCGGTRRQYPSVVRIAADPWLRALTTQERASLRSVCAPLPRHGLTQLPKERFPQYQDFPFEGIAVYETRYAEAAELAAENKRADLLGQLRKTLTGLYRDRGQPNPYLAVLLADGDAMGKAIAAIDSPEKHREFSAALSGFASEASGVVIRHHGTLVYSGGDDVLAFVPVDKALVCARALSDSFRDALGPHANPLPTLSVGVAIGHMMDPLEDLLRYARAAEKLAKLPDKNGLAISFHVRNGGVLSFRAQWSANPDQFIWKLALLYRHDRVPDGAAYELKRIADFYATCTGDWATSALKMDAYRSLTRKAFADDEARDEVFDLLAGVNSPSDLLRFTSALLIARRIADASPAARGPNGTPSISQPSGETA